MFEQPVTLMTIDSVVTPGNYAIVDWVGNNPMNPNTRIPVVVAFNLTPDDMKKVESGEMSLPRMALGTNQRIVLQIVQSKSFEDGKVAVVSSITPENEPKEQVTPTPTVPGVVK
jgi:hypothetical protein